jgi:vancomycin permeability regulator SanA
MHNGTVASPSTSQSSATRVRRRWLTIVVVAAIAAAALIVPLSGSWVSLQAAGRVFEAHDAPSAPIAIVLGAAVSEEGPGSYLKGRLDTALGLFRNGLVETIIVSGDAIPPYDDEVAVMRKYLEDRGIPSDRIIDDPRGFDTDDTCRRAHTVYGVQHALLVTQNFHAARAVALCRAWKIDAFGVIAACDCSDLSLIRNYIREVFVSRPAAFIYALRT